MQKPHTSHFHSIIRIVRYVKVTIDYGIMLSSKSDLSLKGFTDSDWAGCPTTRRDLQWLFCYAGSQSHIMEIK